MGEHAKDWLHEFLYFGGMHIMTDHIDYRPCTTFYFANRYTMETMNIYGWMELIGVADRGAVGDDIIEMYDTFEHVCVIGMVWWDLCGKQLLMIYSFYWNLYTY